MEDNILCSNWEIQLYKKQQNEETILFKGRIFFYLIFSESDCYIEQTCEPLSRLQTILVNSSLTPVISYRKLHVLNNFLCSKQNAFELRSLKRPHFPLVLPLFSSFVRAPETQFCQSTSQKHQANHLFQTYFEMGTTSSMSKPTRGLWFNCFTNPLSTTYLEKIHTVREDNNRGLNRQTGKCHIHISSEQEHNCPTFAAEVVALCWPAAALQQFDLQDVTDNASPHPATLCWFTGADLISN